MLALLAYVFVAIKGCKQMLASFSPDGHFYDKETISTIGPQKQSKLLNTHLPRDIDPVPCTIAPYLKYNRQLSLKRHLYLESSCIADAINDRMELFAKSHADGSWIVGRLLCDAENAHLDQTGAVLEERRSADAMRSRLDLSRLDPVPSIFPGQMVAVKGQRRYVGSDDIPHAIIVDEFVASHSSIPRFGGQGFPLRITIGLGDALGALKDTPPSDLYIAIGPFDLCGRERKSPELPSLKRFKHLYYESLATDKPIIYCPAAKDMLTPDSAFLDFPRPPLGRSFDRACFVASPDILSVSFGELAFTIGICAAEALAALEAEVFPRTTEFSALARHIVHQASYTACSIFVAQILPGHLGKASGQLPSVSLPRYAHHSRHHRPPKQ